MTRPGSATDKDQAGETCKAGEGAGGGGGGTCLTRPGSATDKDQAGESPRQETCFIWSGSKPQSAVCVLVIVG